MAATGGAEGGAEAVDGTAGCGRCCAGAAGAWPAGGVCCSGAADGCFATGGRNGPPLFSGGRNGAGRKDAPEADFGRRGIVGTAEDEGFGKSIAVVGRERSRVGRSSSGKGLESDFDSPARRDLICSIVAESTELECVFFPRTPNSGNRSMISFALTSSFRANSLIRIVVAPLRSRS